MASATDGTMDTPPVNVLLVDDEPINLLALEAVLDGLGQNLIRAESGEQALRHLLQEDFAVVLLDVRMGGLDGFATAKLIRGRERSRHTPIIFLTAYSGSDFPAEAAYELGAVDYLVKPLVPVILRAKVAGFVQLFQQADRLRRLERRAAERDAAEHALRARADALAEADRRKDDFLAMFAHELRNPLAPLLTGLEVARQAGANAEARNQALGMMERQARHLSRLVDDLLDVSRIVRGRVQIRRERLDLARLVRDTAEDRRRTLGQASLTLAAETPETPVWVNGDATRLAQVLNNLLDNAAKFTAPGGKVTVRLATGDCRLAVLTISDTGLGIEPEMLDRLFDVFSQADRSLDRSRGLAGPGALGGQAPRRIPRGPGRGRERGVRARGQVHRATSDGRRAGGVVSRDGAAADFQPTPQGAGGGGWLRRCRQFEVVAGPPGPRGAGCLHRARWGPRGQGVDP